MSRYRSVKGPAFASGLAVLSLLASMSGAQSLEWLGPTNGGVRDGANISGDGGTVAYVSASGDLQHWTPGGGNVSLGSGRSPTGLSPDGSTIVGNSSGLYTYGYGWRWTESGGFVPLPLSTQTPPASGSYAVGISNLGRVGGGADAGAAGAPASWETTGTQSYADALSNYLIAYGISPDGTVMVGMKSNASSNQGAVRWEMSGGVWTRSVIGTNPGSAVGLALAASNAGDVILGANSTSFDAGWYWTQATGIQLLDEGGFGDVTAYALSADGSKIVGYGHSGTGNIEALLWDGAGSTPRRLEEILTSDYGFDLGGDQLVYASDVSADGLTIVGKGNEFGVTGLQAFRLQFPPPAAPVPAMQPWALRWMALLLLGTALLPRSFARSCLAIAFVSRSSGNRRG